MHDHPQRTERNSAHVGGWRRSVSARLWAAPLARTVVDLLVGFFEWRPACHERYVVLFTVQCIGVVRCLRMRIREDATPRTAPDRDRGARSAGDTRRE